MRVGEGKAFPGGFHVQQVVPVDAVQQGLRPVERPSARDTRKRYAFHQALISPGRQNQHHPVEPRRVGIVSRTGVLVHLVTLDAIRGRKVESSRPHEDCAPDPVSGEPGHQQPVFDLEYTGGLLDLQMVESVDLVLAQGEPEAEVSRQQRLEPFGFPAIPMPREVNVPQFGRKPLFLFEENTELYFGSGEEAVQRVPLPQPDPGVAVPFGQGRIVFVEDLFEGVLADPPVIQQPDQFRQGRFDGRARDARTVDSSRTVECGV